ncbi:MAG: sigma-70 family RNA polymerase sigma factor [Spirochaetes bacterium]|nr:MAG: sigma-70 family RNA polymerase sigma factor [Spirochaetota bacterium]
MDAVDESRAELDRTYARCYKAYAAPLRRFVAGLVHDEYAAEEIVQDTFMKLYEKKVALDESRPTLRSFLYIVARHRSLDYLAKCRREDRVRTHAAFDEAIMDDRFYRDLADAVIEGEVISTLHDTLNSIPEKKREIFIRRAMLDMKLNQVMKDLDVSTYTIKKVEHEVRLRIRDSLSRYYAGG